MGKMQSQDITDCVISGILKKMTPDVNSGHERLSHAATCLA